MSIRTALGFLLTFILFLAVGMSSLAAQGFEDTIVCFAALIAAVLVTIMFKFR